MTEGISAGMTELISVGKTERISVGKTQHISAGMMVLIILEKSCEPSGYCITQTIIASPKP